MYGEVILEHSRHPRNYGSLESPDLRHEHDNPLCGDRVRIEMSLAPDGSVRAARFQGDLCAIAKAASSLLTEMLTGMTLEEASSITHQRMVETLRDEIPQSRLPCAHLPLDVVHAAIAEYRSSQCTSREP